MQYVAAHTEAETIIGTGIVAASANFIHTRNDANRGGAPRLDFFFYRSDLTCCRLHPGSRRKQDAKPIFSTYAVLTASDGSVTLRSA